MEPNAALPENAVAFPAPPQFTGWWASTQECAGQRGRLESIAWFVVPGSSFMTAHGPMVGRWSRGGAGTQIVVAGDFVHDQMVIRHEMLHALIDVEGHPREYFVDRCHLTWQSWGQ